MAKHRAPFTTVIRELFVSPPPMNEKAGQHRRPKDPDNTMHASADDPWKPDSDLQTLP